MGFFDILTGAAEAGSKDIERRRASALELKMRSRLMEQEMLQKQALMEQEASTRQRNALEMYEHERLPVEDSRAAAKLLGIRGPSEGQPGYHPRQFETLNNLFALGRGRGGLGFAGDQPLHELTKKRMVRAGYAKKYADEATRADASKLKLEPHTPTYDEVRRFITAAEVLPQYKEAVKDIFGKKFTELSAKGGLYTKVEFAKKFAPEFAALRRRLLSVLAPADAGKAQTVTELANLEAQLGEWYQDRIGFEKAIEGLEDRIIERHIKAPIDSGVLGEAREDLVKMFNEGVGKKLKKKPLGKYLPGFEDEEEEERKKQEAQKAAQDWVKKIKSALPPQ